MNKNLEKQIFDYLYKHLSPSRFEHSYNVAMLAVELALKHKENTFKAQIAGLLHDCAKNMEQKEMIKILKKNKGTKLFLDMHKFSPKLLHSFASEVIAKKEFKIKNKDILNAIKNHTLGRPNMSNLEKIIFVADCGSEDRKFKEAKNICSVAKTNLDKALLQALQVKMQFVIYDNAWLCPTALDTWNFYVCKKK
ncbi:MAG: bis(5'-nucleosyl)-tetraphosphatase (symmetrical) YqeK [Endomicrobium sp.]|jgi:predicted HD superfamily hydrolase involved in NAD metabolism|nr:bis(5'-nucleosyl)-tetraphosphatase (symmetrical) YqeK [Endomicrobium sp.]